MYLQSECDVLLVGQVPAVPLTLVEPGAAANLRGHRKQNLLQHTRAIDGETTPGISFRREGGGAKVWK